MKTIEELLKLRDELKTAYESVLANPETGYDQATVSYALKCYQDAEQAYFRAGVNAAIEKAKEKGLASGTTLLGEFEYNGVTFEFNGEKVE